MFRIVKNVADIKFDINNEKIKTFKVGYFLRTGFSFFEHFYKIISYAHF